MFSKLLSLRIITLILALTHRLYAITFDPSCKNFEGRDQTDTLTNAVQNAIDVAQFAHTRLDLLMTMKKFMPSGDAKRLEGLLTAFYIPPNITPGYTIAQSGLLRALESIKDASVASFPAKIYCGSQTTTPDDPNPRGKFVKYEKDPKTGLPYMKDNKLSFAYQEFLTPGGAWLPAGLDICGEGFDAMTEAPHWIVLCSDAWTTGSGATFPTSEDDRNADFWTRNSPENTLDYYASGLYGTLLHEMHHLFVRPSSDVPLPGLPKVRGEVAKAYDYVGVTELAKQTIANRQYGDLFENADSVTYFGQAVWLENTDWTGNIAKPLP